MKTTTTTTTTKAHHTPRILLTPYLSLSLVRRATLLAGALLAFCGLGVKKQSSKSLLQGH
jgi:hypothetical protein